MGKNVFEVIIRNVKSVHVGKWEENWEIYIDNVQWEVQHNFADLEHDVSAAKWTFPTDPKLTIHSVAGVYVLRSTDISMECSVLG